MNDDIDLEDAAPWIALFITIAGFIMRVLLLESKGLWLDETFSIWMANLKVGEMLQWVVKIDQHPPLYYFLLHGWIGIFGDSPYYVRLLSVLFGTGAIPIVYLIGKRMSSPLMGVVAAAFLAFSPFNIYYSQEARMYSLLLFNASMAIYALVRLLTDPRALKPIGSQFREYIRVWHTAPPIPILHNDGQFYIVESKRSNRLTDWINRHHWLPMQEIETDLAWVGFILFSILTLYSHNTAVFFVVAVNVFVLGLMLFQRKIKPGAMAAFQAPSFLNWGKAHLWILVFWLPWIFSFIKQAGSVFKRFWIPAPTWEAVLDLIKTMVNPSAQLPKNLSMGIWIFFGIIFCLGLIHFRKKISQFVFLAILFATPLLGELLVSIWRPIFSGRTLIWITLPLLLVLGAGISKLKFRFLIIIVLGSLLTINLFSVSDYFRFYQKEDWNTAARTVAGLAEDDDLILFNSNFVEIPFNYYIESYETKQYLRLEKVGLPLDLIDDGVLEPVMAEADIPALISKVSGYERVFLVYSHDSYTDPDGLIPQTLASQMRLVRSTDFKGGTVQFYERP
ncbi:MAG: hypothetical protein CVU42_08850 [Chloroflexi bacterium HGW-Chloroflexi-4]|jgi:hypothetical protein|nr:MAG: hypothetical protein CVU42_08850 [Chloroflexi bacterium HGW-Chloroflexi-4]